MARVSAVLCLTLTLPLAVLLGLVVAPRAVRSQALVIGDETERFRGAPISVDVKNGELSEFLRLIARSAGVSLVVDPGVGERTVNLSLEDVPWDQALTLVLEANDLVGDLTGKVLRVTTAQDELQRAQQAAQLQQARDFAAPLVSVARRLSYGDAQVAEQLVRQQLSPRGRVMVDRRTNTLIIRDVPSVVEEIAGPSAALTSDVRRPAAPPVASERVRLDAWIVETRADVLSPRGARLSERRRLPGTSAHLGRGTLPPRSVPVSVFVAQLVDGPSARLVDHVPFALSPGLSHRFDLGRVPGAPSVALEVALELDGRRPMLVFRIRRAGSTARAPLAWATGLAEPTVVELDPGDGASRRVLIVAAS